MDKRLIIHAFIEYFTRERDALMTSAKAAHEAATHSESTAEDRHDTFAIELSYLASGQAERVQSLSKSIQEFEQLLTQTGSSKIAVRGSLVTLEHAGKKIYSMLANHGGGARVEFERKTITVVTSDSPLGSELFGSRAGDELTIETKDGAKEYEVLSCL